MPGTNSGGMCFGKKDQRKIGLTGSDKDHVIFKCFISFVFSDY
jgi:hypothetical protein